MNVGMSAPMEEATDVGVWRGVVAGANQAFSFVDTRWAKNGP